MYVHRNEIGVGSLPGGKQSPCWVGVQFIIQILLVKVKQLIGRVRVQGLGRVIKEFFLVLLPLHLLYFLKQLAWLCITGSSCLLFIFPAVSAHSLSQRPSYLPLSPLLTEVAVQGSNL